MRGGPVLALLALACIPGHAQFDDDYTFNWPNGRFWTALNRVAKANYILGYCDGADSISDTDLNKEWINNPAHCPRWSGIWGVAGRD